MQISIENTLQNPKTSVPEKISYHDYLQLSKLLDLQIPLAKPEHHDEMLFIIVHQCHELWFKLIIHEFCRLSEKLAQSEMLEVLKTLRRLQEIFKLLNEHMNILNTLSPDEFAGYRNVLAPASGFQSYQFRMIEFLCGAKDANFLECFKKIDDVYLLMKKLFDAPSLCDVIEETLKKRNLIPQTESPADKSNVVQGILTVYKEREKYSDLHFLFENLVDFDVTVQLWRSLHVKIAERMIGKKMGTGGSSGVDYLASITSKKLFPELWEVRSFI